MGAVETRRFHVDNGEGWELALLRHTDPDTFDPQRRPVMILPGYGMNSFIFTFHPGGPSMAEHMARAGFEFWTVDLRAQGESVCRGGSRCYTMTDAALTDLPQVLDAIAAHTTTSRDRVDLVGCSLGASYGFMHVALSPTHRVGALVAIGGPLRYRSIHPALRLAFASPAVVGAVPFRGTRTLAGIALPAIGQHAPWLVRLYLRAENVDLDKAQAMVQTVEDPVPAVNRQIARWLRDGDLIVDGRNVTEEMGRFTGPFFCIFGNADGVVPKATATTAFSAVGSPIREILELGDAHVKMAHADPYISRYSHDALFEPIAAWLARDDVQQAC